MSMPDANRFGNQIDKGPPCKPEITPIIPVRFSLTQKAIENMLNNTVPNPPDKIGATNYQLRRLRQGYLYIYAVAGAMVGDSSDGVNNKVGKWLVFEYHVSNEDSNGSLMLDMVNLALGKVKSALGYAEEKRVGLPYHFRKYSWQNGSAKNKWIPDNQSYPYAFVNSQVSLIDFAYSERCWPAELFELLESREDIRKTVMQRVSLKAENSTYSFPFEQLAKNVADFNPDEAQKKQDEKDSRTRRTALGYSQKHQITITDEQQRKRARVIAVHDPIGNIADVSCFHEYTWINLINEQRKYLYATTTARAVKSVESHLRKKSWKTLWKDYPVDEDNLKKLEEYAAKDFLTKQSQSIIIKLQNIAKTHIAMIEQTGAFTLDQQLKLVTQQAVGFTGDDPQRLNAVNAYAAFLAYSAFQQISISTQGMEQLARGLAEDQPYGKYVKSILKMAEKVTAGYALSSKAVALKRLELEVMFESVMTAQLYRWSSKPLKSGSITQDTYLSAFGLRRGHLRVNGAGDIYSTYLEEQTRAFVQNRAVLSRTSRFNQAVEQTVTQTRSQQAYVVLIGLDEKVQGVQNKLHITHKAGIFFSTLALRDTLDSFNEDADNALLNPIFQTTTSLMGLIAAFNYDRNGIVNEGLKNIAKTTKTALSTIFSQENVLVQRFGRMAEGSGSLSSRAFTFIGHTANALGLLVVIGEGIKAQRKNDRMALTSTTLGGLSEVALIVADLGWLGASATTPLVVVGLVLLLASLVIYQFADNDMESWVRSGFWGNSTKYWEKDRQHFFPINKRLSVSQILATNNDPDYEMIKNFFEKEMNDFYNLVWGLTIENIELGDNKLRVLCPAFTNATSVNQLTIKWQQNSYWMGIGERGEQYTALDSAGIRKKWLYSGCIELDFSAAVRLSRDIQPDSRNHGRKLAMIRGELTVSFPHIGGAKGEFSQTRLFSPQEI